jgi:multiple sugar transport system substrate-binding protein
MLRKQWLASSFLAISMLCGAALGARADDLVTADLVGKADAPNTLVFRTNPDFTQTSPTAGQGAGFKALFQTFAEKHPDWQIQFQYFTPDIGGEHARMLEQARAGRGPDCATVDSFQLALFVKNNVLAPVDQYFTKDELADLFPFVHSGITGPDGHIYAWWWNTDIRVLYRNKDIVKDAPQTWADLKATALAALKGGAQEGVLFNGGRWEGTAFDWLANFWAQGGKLVDDSGKPIFGEGDNRAMMLKALAYYKDLVDSGAAPKRVATIKDYADFNAAALAGTPAMFLGGHWQHFQLKEAMKPEEFAKWDISEFPGPTADKRSTGAGGWTVAALSKDPAKIKACMDLVREIYMGPANEVMGQLPTRASLFTNLKTFQDPFFAQIKQYLAHGQARPGVPIYPEISNQIQIAMGDVLTGAKSPEQALDDAWKAVQDAYKKM